MPLPILAGLPWLAGVIGSLFTAIFTFVATYVTKRLAVTIAVTAVMLTVTLGFFVAIKALFTGIAYAMPANVVELAPILLPTNLDECLSALVSGRVLRWAYSWNVRIIQFKLF